MKSEISDTYIKGFFDEYRFLSNFYPCSIEWMNMQYSSVESAYQASKCHRLEDAKYFTILDAKESKNIIKTMQIRKDWDLIKFDIMSQLVFQKFLKDIKLRNLLIDTYPKYLEETNSWNDTYWGVCKSKGKNNLGKILMATREYFIITVE